MIHGGKKCLSWVSIFSCVLQCPLQLDSVELFMNFENLSCIWLMHTEQTFGQPNCNMFFWHCIFVSVLPLICWFPTFSLPSHIQPYGTEPGHCDKYFPWQCQHEFPFTCARACVDVCVPSPVRWFPFVRTVIRLLRLHTICQAINKVTQIQRYF